MSKVIIGKNKNMKSESMHNFEKENFYHRLRLIFTYYASQRYKQHPLVMREKSFQKFLNDSTISEIIKTQIKQKTQTKSQSKNKGHEEGKNLQISANTYHKPMHFDKFKNLITKLLYQTRYNGSQEQEFQEQQVQTDLFNLYQSDQIVSGIFSFLYEEIEQGTQFGNLIIFSQNKEFFNKEVWRQVKIQRLILKKIYAHYFNQIVPKEQDKVEEVLSVLKKFCLDFEIAPLKVSMTEIFIIVWEIINAKSISVYEQHSNEKQKIEGGIKGQRWDAFSYTSFAKMIILIANLIQRKQSKIDKEEYGPNTIRNFLEYMGTTKGYKNFKSIYKINHSFYTSNSNQLLSPIQKSNKSSLNLPMYQKVLYFEPKSIGLTKEFDVVKSFEKFLSLVFKSYTQGKQPELMSKKQLEKLCSQLKSVPHLISKKQIGQIYQKVTSERDYFYLQNENNSHSQSKRIPQENKLKIYQLVSKPQFGLKFEEFEKFLVYAAQLNKVCEKLTTVQRLIYWIEYMFSQDRAKIFMQKSRTREKFFVEKQLNLTSIYQKPKHSHTEHNFYAQHESMYKKLKKTLK